MFQHSRIVFVAAVVLSTTFGALPSSAHPPEPLDDIAPITTPYLGEAEIGCTRHSGGPVCNGHHSYHAIDFLMPTGTPIVAPVDGVVVGGESGCANVPGSCGNGYGNWIEVSADDGSANYLMAHLSEVLVAEGWVAAGTILGYSGTSGGSSVDHMHFERRSHHSEARKGEQMAVGRFAACEDGKGSLVYPAAAGSGTWYALPSHGGVFIAHDGPDCRPAVLPKVR